VSPDNGTSATHESDRIEQEISPLASDTSYSRLSVAKSSGTERVPAGPAARETMKRWNDETVENVHALELTAVTSHWLQYYEVAFPRRAFDPQDLQCCQHINWTCISWRLSFHFHAIVRLDLHIATDHSW